ncbi:hypothetical protein BB561_005162 [Smittium simulii]|uniref:Uncharacterized protein n=1 Tax=Smittium simulii TaxID=133385 RepID=A0A2T9YBT4_9FUNG|nr:hypothetical protein BB561_005162 [Smittium simulii]
MDCHGDSEQSSNSELRILEIESAKMERSTAWGIVVESQSYSVLWPPSIVSAHINVKELLAVYYALQLHSVVGRPIRAKIWGNYLSQITRSLRKIVVSLYKDKHMFSDVLCTNVHQPGRRAIKTNSSNGMVSFNRDIQETEQNIWPYDVDLFATKQNKKLSKYYSWYQDSQSVGANAPSHSWLQWNAPTVVPLSSNYLLIANLKRLFKSSTGKNNYDNNYDNVKVCNLVSNSGKNQNSRAHTNTGVRDYARPIKRQISSTQEQILVADGIENQRRTLQQEGLTDLNLDLITANTRSVKRRSRYYTTQKEFID